jgi:hypothetical protein
MLLVNIIIYAFPFLSSFIISSALLEAYEVGEKLDKLHMAMAKRCSVRESCHAANLPQTKLVRLGDNTF